MTGNRRPEAVRGHPRRHRLCQRKEELLRPAPWCTGLSITRLFLTSQVMLKAGWELLWATSLAFISTVCQQSPICEAKLRLSPHQCLPLKGEMGVRMGSSRWLCRMRVEGVAPWMAFCLCLVTGRLLAWLCSVLMLDIEQVPWFTHPSCGHNSSLGAHQHL